MNAILGLTLQVGMGIGIAVGADAVQGTQPPRPTPQLARFDADCRQVYDGLWYGGPLAPAPKAKVMHTAATEPNSIMVMNGCGSVRRT